MNTQATSAPRQPKRLQYVVRLPLLIATAMICGSDVQAPVRLALVIGNSSYAYSDQLPNALNDAHKLTAKLGLLGFQVQPAAFDLKRSELGKAISAFGDRLRAAGPNVIGFFYYAGHAAQDAYGVNYLLPIDAKARTPEELRGEGTPVQALLKAMEDANNTINIIVLDSCRDWYKNDRSPQDPKGLHDMGLHASVLIAYATRADDTADEGAKLDSSPFSHRLLEALDKQAGDPIVLLFDDVKGKVYSDTDAGQYPLLVDGLTVSGRWSFTSNLLSQVASKPEPLGTGSGISPFLKQLDRARLIKFFLGKESLADTLLARRDVLQKYGINTPNRLAYFLANIGFETVGFRINEERFGYSAERLRALFSTRVTTDEMAHQLAGKPELVANVIYANRIGNGPAESGDGWRYRGRGFFSITGRANYARYGAIIGVDLLRSPDLANDPEIGFAVAAAVWLVAGANSAADTDDLSSVTRRLTGPFVPPLGGRAMWLMKAKDALH